MKLLTDFDGVWTDPREEADLGFEVIVEEVSRLGGLDSSDARFQVESVRTEVLANPTTNGWESSGAIAAFSEEDPYITNNAICRAIALNYPDLWAPLSKEFADFDDFSYSCYRGGVSRHAEKSAPLLRPGAKSILSLLLDRGWDIVYASNSTGEKLRGCLGELADEAGGPIRVRGSARKFVLTSSDENQKHEFSGRNVRIDRGFYQEILEEERPDIIVGDVFSLDLALPARLCMEGVSYLQRGLVLYRTEYTPKWSLQAAEETSGIEIVDSLEAFAEHLGG